MCRETGYWESPKKDWWCPRNRNKYWTMVLHKQLPFPEQARSQLKNWSLQQHQWDNQFTWLKTLETSGSIYLVLVIFQKVTKHQGQDSELTTQLSTFAALLLHPQVLGKYLPCLGTMWHTENVAEELDRQECCPEHGPEDLCFKIFSGKQTSYVKCSTQWLYHHAVYHSYYYDFHFRKRVDQGSVMGISGKGDCHPAWNLWDGSGYGLGAIFDFCK